MKIRRLALVLGISVALVMGGCAMLQDRLLYFPTKGPLDQLVPAGVEPWPSEGAFRGLIATPPAESGAVRGTAIVFHGNAGYAGDRTYYSDALPELGFRVVLAEYPGQGPRDGALGEVSLVADARGSIALAHQMYGTPVLVVGESLGAGVAAAATAQLPDQVSAVLLITLWDSVQRVAAFQYPWLPTRWLLRDSYDSAVNLKNFSGPVQVVVADQDRVVPAQFGRALHAAFPRPKRLVVLPEASHNDWLGQVDAAWWRTSMAFLMGEPSG